MSRHLISVAIEGFKRIKVAYLEFGDKPGLTLVTGRNANGKSSSLDAIYACLAGKDAMPENPIHDGMTEARVRCRVGELIVTRTFKRKPDGEKVTTELKVEAADGAVYSSPQQMMNDLFGRFTFDPLAFAGMDEKKQFDALKHFVRGVDFELMERLQAGETERRRDHGREVKRLTALVESIAYPPDTPRQPISIDRLSRDLQKAGEANQTRERLIAGKEAIRKQVSQLTIENERLKALIVANHSQIEELADRFEHMEIPAEVDVAQLRRELTEANATNKHVEKLRERRDAEAMLKTETDAVAALTKSMTERAESVRAAIAKAEMPIAGLSLAGGGVTFNGQPLSQASHAEKLRASVAIAMSQNPDLRVILVHEGGRLDSDGLKIISDMALERDYRVIVERVDESGGVGIVMVDGMVESTPESREAGVAPTSLPVAGEAKPKGKRR